MSIHSDVSKRLCPTKHCERKGASGMQCKGVLNNHGFRAWATANGGVLSTIRQFYAQKAEAGLSFSRQNGQVWLLTMHY
ncbi:hypothetical protein O166_14445 [Pseudogulbenkiania ferrooxidans EGD-HP2]|uniref:Uncharacterized protein n=1 Tax=Pseudogulbenkiania ferrooxidans EGD-HP2 TaxID=1388764 RepID=A0ABN0N2Z4_9NEIS|nr:hypothetical protein O166_14445 [Pseudogulbenkiania ferrooxidans EGD-HP2]